MRPRTISLKQLCQLWPDVPRKTWQDWRKAATTAAPRRGVHFD